MRNFDESFFASVFQVRKAGIGQLTHRVTALAHAALVLVASAFAGQAWATFGSNDPTFGNAGVTSFENKSVRGIFQNLTNAARDSEGRIYVLGIFPNSQGTAVEGIVRLSANGILDASFGDAGVLASPKVTLPPPNSGGMIAHFDNLAAHPDGQHLYLSYVSSLASSKIVLVAKISLDGSLDSSFGDVGVATIDLTAGQSPIIVGAKLLVQPDGKIFVVGAGRSGSIFFPGGTSIPFVVRLMTDGAIDTSYGFGGIAIGESVPAFFAVELSEPFLDKAGRLWVLVGHGVEASPNPSTDPTAYGYATRFTVNGLLDINIKKSIPDGKSAFVLGTTYEDGTIVLIHRAYRTPQDDKYSVYQLFDNGALRPDFGLAGIKQIVTPSPKIIQLQTPISAGTGKLLLLGEVSTGYRPGAIQQVSVPDEFFPRPAAPTNLTAAAGDASIALSWTADANATSYNVYQGTAPGGEGVTPVKSGIADSASTITGLTNGTRYYFTVRSVNPSGPSPSSAEASAVPVAPPPPILATSFTASRTTLTQGESSILTWTSQNATNCIATGAWSGNKALQGSETVVPTVVVSTYTLTCTGSGQSLAKSATITVSAPPPNEGGGGGSMELLTLFSLLLLAVARNIDLRRGRVRSSRMRS